MIGVGDIGNILYRDCKAFGLEVYQKGNIPSGEITTERIIISPKAQIPDTFWAECYVEVNICVPDKLPGTADLIRLHELEHQAKTLLNNVVGNFNECNYAYSIDTIGYEQDTDMRCHYVNVSILFKVLNIN